MVRPSESGTIIHEALGQVLHPYIAFLVNRPASHQVCRERQPDYSGTNDTNRSGSELSALRTRNHYYIHVRNFRDLIRPA